MLFAMNVYVQFLEIKIMEALSWEGNIQVSGSSNFSSCASCAE